MGHFHNETRQEVKRKNNEVKINNLSTSFKPNNSKRLNSVCF